MEDSDRVVDAGGGRVSTGTDWLKHETLRSGAAGALRVDMKDQRCLTNIETRLDSILDAWLVNLSAVKKSGNLYAGWDIGRRDDGTLATARAD